MRFRAVLIAGIAAAALSFSTVLLPGTPRTGAACKKSACTYFLADGSGVSGTCGSKRSDLKNCYCFDNGNKKLSQKQSGCMIKSD